MNINFFAKNAEIGGKVLYRCPRGGWNFVGHTNGISQLMERNFVLSLSCCDHKQLQLRTNINTSGDITSSENNPGDIHGTTELKGKKKEAKEKLGRMISKRMLGCKMRQNKIRAGPDVNKKKAGKEWEQE